THGKPTATAAHAHPAASAPAVAAAAPAAPADQREKLALIIAVADGQSWLGPRHLRGGRNDARAEHSRSQRRGNKAAEDHITHDCSSFSECGRPQSSNWRLAL